MFEGLAYFAEATIDVPVTAAEVVAMAERARPPGAPRPRDEAAIAGGITAAVNAEPEPLFGSRAVDAGVMVVFARRESGMKACGPAGDHGMALGTFQLHDTRAGVACDPGQAARLWLARARLSFFTCTDLPAPERLAALASGSCAHGRKLSRERVEAGTRLAAP